MKLSASEVTALATKAARGAGAPAGQAAMFGAAVRFHLGAGRPEREIERALAALPGRGPVLELPVLLMKAEEAAGEVVPVSKATSLMQSYLDAAPYEFVLSGGGTQLTFRPQINSPPTLPRRLEMSDALFALLSGLAARILVPESDASRIAGAGAGLSDND